MKISWQLWMLSIVIFILSACAALPPVASDSDPLSEKTAAQSTIPINQVDKTDGTTASYKRDETNDAEVHNNLASRIVTYSEPRPLVVKRGIEVLVFFGYQCGHCFQFYQESLKQWLSNPPEGVKVLLIPTIWPGTHTEIAARTLITASLMGYQNEAHAALFTEFYSKKQRFTNIDEVKPLLKDCCAINDKTFERLYHSKVVDEVIERNQRLTELYGIVATPAVAVGGQYLASFRSAQSSKNLLTMIQIAIENVRKTIVDFDSSFFTQASKTDSQKTGLY